MKGAAAAKRAHPPGAAKAKEAQDAALAPADDLAGQAKAAKVDTMDAQQPGTFDKKAFIAAVKAAIEAKSPKTLKEADDYKESGKAGEVKGEVAGLVSTGKDGQAKDIETATDAPPDQSKAVAKPVTPMAPEQPGQAPPVAAAGAAPKPAPAEQLNLAAGPHEANQEMAQGEVTEQQLAQSNEPQFQQALADKQAAAAHAQTAPAQFRQHEQQVVAQHKADATAQTAAGVAGMQSSKGAALAALVAAKGKTKTKDEAKRAEVTGEDPGHLRRDREGRQSHPRRARPQGRRRVHPGRGGSAAGVRVVRRRARCAPTRRTATAAGWAGCAGPRTSCSGCPTRSTSSTRPAASSTSSRWTG